MRPLLPSLNMRLHATVIVLAMVPLVLFATASRRKPPVPIEQAVQPSTVSARLNSLSVMTST